MEVINEDNTCMKVILIRHGATLGNQEKRYIGITDEALCDAGIEKLLPWSDFIKERCSGLIDVENQTPEYHEPLPV